MPGILCDTLLLLRSPAVVLDTELDVSFNTYLASSSVDGHHFAFSVAQPVPPAGSPLVPHGAVGDVQGSLTVYKTSLLFTATTVAGLYLPTAELNRRDTRKLFQPTVTFVGKVKHIHPTSLRTPNIKVVDISVDCEGVWPYEDTVLTCYFNSRKRRFKRVTLYEVGASLSVSGDLIGWNDGKLAVEVHSASRNHVGELPGRVLSALPNLFEKLDISNSFAVFTDPCSLPPRAGIPSSLRGARTTSAQWLEIVAGLPANDSSHEDASTESTQPVASGSGSQVVARRAVGRHGTRGCRAAAQPPIRSPLSELDMNVPVAEVAAAT